MKPTPKVVIGKNYTPMWFERRHSDGRYEGFNAPMSQEEYRIQRAMLGECDTENPLAWACIFAWAFILLTLVYIAP